MNTAAQPKGQRNADMDIPLRKLRGVDEIDVSPELAQHWLTFNTANRQITKSKLDQFINDMSSGHWYENGDTIRFSYGKLLDGQHRLKAIMTAGVVIRTLVVYGLDVDSQISMDTGKTRTPRDVLSIEGLDAWESVTLGSAAHAMISMSLGRPVYTQQKYVNREIRAFYLEHQAKLDASIRVCKTYPRRRPVLPLARVMTLHYLFASRDENMANEFFERLMTGASLEKESPIYHLRRLLDDDLHAGRKRSVYELLGLVIKTWNAFRRGSTMKSASSLHVKSDENFPEIR